MVWTEAAISELAAAVAGFVGVVSTLGLDGQLILGFHRGIFGLWRVRAL